MKDRLYIVLAILGWVLLLGLSGYQALETDKQPCEYSP